MLDLTDSVWRINLQTYAEHTGVSGGDGYCYTLSHRHLWALTLVGCCPTQAYYRQGTCATHFPPPWLFPTAPFFWRAFPHLLKSFTSLKTLHNASAVGSFCCSSQLYSWLPRRPQGDSDGSLHPIFFTLAERLMKPHFFGLRWAKALLKRWMCAGREPPIPTLVCCQEFLSTDPAPSRRASSAGRSPRGHGLPPHFTDEGTEA